MKIILSPLLFSSNSNSEKYTYKTGPGERLTGENKHI